MSWAYRCTHSLFHSNSKRNDINEFLFDETDPFGIDNSEIYKHFKNMLIARKQSHTKRLLAQLTEVIPKMEKWLYDKINVEIIDKFFASSLHGKIEGETHLQLNLCKFNKAHNQLVIIDPVVYEYKTFSVEYINHLHYWSKDKEVVSVSTIPEYRSQNLAEPKTNILILLVASRTLLHLLL